MKQYSLFEKHKFFGQFWPCDNRDYRFAATIKCIPGRAIELSALIFDDQDSSVFDNTQILHGVTEDSYVTLVGCTISQQVVRSENILLRILSSYLIIGGHFGELDAYRNITLEPSNFLEFCHPQGFMRRDEYSSKPILEGKLPWGGVAFKKNGSGNMLKCNEISSLLRIDEKQEEFRKQLNEMTEKLAKSYNIRNLFSKKNIGTYLIISYDKPKGVMDFNCDNNVKRLTNLFSIFIINSIYPIHVELDLQKKVESETKKCPVIYPVHLSMERNHKDISYYNMPVNITHIKENFNKILNEWNLMSSGIDSFIIPTMIQHIQGDFNPIQHVITIISSLEQWVSKYEETTKDKHYDYMIDKYATDHTRNFLSDSLPFENNKNDTLGKLIGHVRNGVLHPKSIKKHNYKEGRELDEISLYNISESIFIILLRAIYRRLHLPEEAINKFGTEDYPVIRSHRTL